METPNTNPIEYQPRTRLTDARNTLGWSQQRLATEIGTTHVNVSRWDRGITRPNPYFRKKLCMLFHKSEIELDLAPSPHTDTLPTTTFVEAATPFMRLSDGKGGIASKGGSAGRQDGSSPSTEPLKSTAIIDRDMPRPAMRLVGHDH